MNETIKKFNYPISLIKEYKYWVILLRPEQVTLGSLVLAYKGEADKLSDIDSKSYVEFGEIIKLIESHLFDLFEYDKINYLALMMVDKNVHFHVIPRYSGLRTFRGVSFIDKGWPKTPDFGYHNDIQKLNSKLIDILTEKFSGI